MRTWALAILQHPPAWVAFGEKLRVLFVEISRESANGLSFSKRFGNMHYGVLWAAFIWRARVVTVGPIRMMPSYCGSTDTKSVLGVSTGAKGLVNSAPVDLRPNAITQDGTPLVSFSPVTVVPPEPARSSSPKRPPPSGRRKELARRRVRTDLQLDVDASPGDSSASFAGRWVSFTSWVSTFISFPDTPWQAYGTQEMGDATNSPMAG